MSFRYSTLFISIVAVAVGCQNIEDATPADRNTFIYYYEAAHNLLAVTAEPTATGFAVLGNEILANGNQNTVLFLTDKNGRQTAPLITIPNGYARAMKVVADGFYILGDSLKRNEASSGEVSTFDFLIYSTRLHKLDLAGTLVNSKIIADTVSTSNRTDIFSSALTINSQNELIILGTSKRAGTSTTERPYLVALHPTTLDTLWIRSYDVLDRDYVNTRALHITSNNKLIWATALLRENQSFSRSYLGIPYMSENSTFENFSTLGEQTDQQIFPADIQPVNPTGLGFGVVGTYASTTGENSNMFFVRINNNGSIVEGSEKFYDAVLAARNTTADIDESASTDTGEALTSTRDGGFVLGGSMITTPERGNGGRDIFLIKTDFYGNLIWHKVIGGIGDEKLTSIRELESGDLLICGTNTVSGLSSIFLMKTDANGELKN